MINLLMNYTEFHLNDYTISTDPALLQIQVVHDYLSRESYWAQGRLIEVVENSIRHSLCFGVYKNDSQIGFARVVTDYSVFAYILDLFIVKDYQGQGLGKWLISCIMSHPELQGKMKWALATKDAHGLYEKFNFSRVKHPEFCMELDKRKMGDNL